MSKGKALVVDDEWSLRELVQQTLEYEDFEVVTAIDGQDALERFQSEGPFLVVVTDLEMPNLTGPELIKKIREINPSQPILLLSGNNSKRVAAEAALGVPSLLKPYTLVRLIQNIDQILQPVPAAH
ncbi:MAG: response regulator [Patescibacteria group bacterium]|mgnify:CR=1 FL=1